jgi:gamma-glutamylcyclotransferase (GGCT)/AIG2-like uncharacterized protein YtfP
MDDRELAEVLELVEAANAARTVGEASDAERRLDARFGTGRTLAVYGTLAPGRPNHHVVAPLGGQWTDGRVEGELFPEGWGTTYGYPALRPRAGGPAVAVHVLRAPSLPGAWARLDRFEGPGYRRVLVPVFAPGEERRLRTVANLYAGR